MYRTNGVIIFNGVGIFYLHLILSFTDNSYSIHVKTVMLALEALPSKKKIGFFSPFANSALEKTVIALLFVHFERGLTLSIADELTTTIKKTT